MPTLVGQGKVAVFSVVGEDQSGNPAPITGTATVSDYNTAYVANTGVKDEYILVPKIILPPGQSVDVNVTFKAIASDGTVISDFVVAFTIAGQPVAVATQVVLTSMAVVDAGSVIVPADPGSPTIQIQ